MLNLFHQGDSSMKWLVAIFACLLAAAFLQTADKPHRDAVEPLRQAADKDADPVTRVVALGALAMMEDDVPGQITALRKYLHHDEPLVRMKACHALGMLGAAAKAAAPEIILVLEQETD